MEHAQFIFAR